MASEAAALDPAPGPRYAHEQLWGHPRALWLLFVTEMWERFSYYGMRAILIFYMTKSFLFTDDKSYAIYGSYTSLVYLMPVFGGIIADRILGYRKAVVVGATLMALGLPYDSDEGRAYAAAITSLMTGHSYLTSARTASRMGPFAGFAEMVAPGGLEFGP